MRKNGRSRFIKIQRGEEGMKTRNRIPKTENQIKQDFYEELEDHNYTKEEVKKYAGSVKFFVSEGAVKRAFNRAYKELYKTLVYVRKNTQNSTKKN